MSPATVRVAAGDVCQGDRIAHRNSCGGFVRWLMVTRTLDAYGCIAIEDGDYVVSGVTERVEIAAR